MLQLLFLIVAIYMFMVFRLLQPNVAVVVSVFYSSFLCCSAGEGQVGMDGGAGVGGHGVLWPWGALGMSHSHRGRGADATSRGAIWGHADSRDTEASGALRRHRGSWVHQC
jgi:hypothetical protein